MLIESEQIHHCPPYLTPDRKFHSYAESPPYIPLGYFHREYGCGWEVWEKILEGWSGEEFIRKDQYLLAPTKSKAKSSTVLTILRNRYYCSHFTDAETKDGDNCDLSQGTHLGSSKRRLCVGLSDGWLSICFLIQLTRQARS